MYLFLNYLLIFLNGMTNLLFIPFFLTPKKGFRFHFTICAVLTLIILYFKVYNPVPVLYDFIILLFIPVTFSYVLFAFQDSVLKKIWIFFLVFFFCNLIADSSISLIAVHLLKIQFTIMDYTTLSSFYVSIIMQFCTIMVYSLFYYTYKKIESKKKKKNSPSLLIIVTAVLLLPLVLFNLTFYDKQVSSFISILYLLLSVFSVLALFYFMLTQDARTKAENDYQELLGQYKLEHQHFEALDLRRIELSKIRHDYNNQLGTIQILLHQGYYKEAKALAENLKEQITSIK